MPSLTEQQRAAALAKAAAARRARSQWLTELRAGSRTLADVFASTDEVVTKMRVAALIDALPGVGKTRAAQIMTRLDIAANRRVGGLGVHQRAALLAEFERRAAQHQASRRRAQHRTPG